MTFPFVITPTPPGSVTLLPGQVGTLSFTVTSMAAPDTVQDVILQALLVGDDGKGRTVDWLVVGPQRTMAIAGGKTETITIAVHPTARTPTGSHRVRLVVASEVTPNDDFVESSPVPCQITAPPPPPPRPAPVPRWWLAAIAAGVVVLVGAAVLITWKVSHKPSGPAGVGAACDSANPCDTALVCVDGTCRRAVGAACQADAECETHTCSETGAGKVCVKFATPSCGARGQTCCPASSGHVCATGLKCIGGECTTLEPPPCGVLGRPCCSGNVCRDGTTCEFGTCTANGTASPQ